MGLCEYFAMPCTKGLLPDGGSFIICSRSGRKSRAKCEFCNTAIHEVLCDFVIPSNGTRERTCSRRICRACAQHVGDDRDLCPPHARLVAASHVVPEMLADPEPFAMRVVADVVESQLEPVAGETERERRLRVRLPERDHAFKPRDYDEWIEYRIERAAIFEYLGEVDRGVADVLARELAGPAPKFAGAGPLFAGAR